MVGMEGCVVLCNMKVVKINVMKINLLVFQNVVCMLIRGGRKLLISGFNRLLVIMFEERRFNVYVEWDFGVCIVIRIVVFDEYLLVIFVNKCKLMNCQILEVSFISNMVIVIFRLVWISMGL